jgi:hypothetical protein
MKLGRLNHIGVAMPIPNFVIASGAKQSSVVPRCPRLLRHFVPRNDEVGLLLRHFVPRNDEAGES